MRSKYIRLLRPIAWITFFFPFSVGFGLGMTAKTSPFHIVFAFIAFISWMSFCFIVNAIGDKDVDKFHDGRSKDMNLAQQPLVTGELNEKEALYLGMIFLFSSLLFAWLVNYLFFILILIVDVFGYVYSMPPMRFKAKPIGDIICNALSAMAIFTAGLSIGGSNMNPLMILAAFIMASIFYMPTVMTDLEFDKKVGLITSAVFFGPKKILRAMYLLTIGLVTIALIIFNFSNLELKIFSLLIITYTLLFTGATQSRLKGERLDLHENWILIPFTLLSIAFVIYGILKLSSLLTTNI